MDNLHMFLLGVLAAWTPSLIVVAIALSGVAPTEE
jgi:hypothetical protein